MLYVWRVFIFTTVQHRYTPRIQQITERKNQLHQNGDSVALPRKFTNEDPAVVQIQVGS